MHQKLLLLGLLRRQDMHGYQLYDFIERDLSICTDIKKPTAYYLLGKMAEDGLITEVHVQDGNRPARRVYSLTAQGEAEFQRLLRENLAEFSPVYFPGDIGLAFMNTLPPGEAAALLQARRQALIEVMGKVESAPTHSGSLALVLEHRKQHLQAELSWLEHIIAYLQPTVS
jgi:DNA-binding PadR family transcriptional regulator